MDKEMKDRLRETAKVLSEAFGTKFSEEDVEKAVKVTDGIVSELGQKMDEIVSCLPKVAGQPWPSDMDRKKAFMACGLLSEAVLTGIEGVAGRNAMISTLAAAVNAVIQVERRTLELPEHTGRWN